MNKPTNLVFSCQGFGNGQPMPKKFTGDDANVSPALQWGTVPTGTLSLALVMDDPDAPAGTWVHWVLYNIPPSLTKLTEAIPVSEKVSGIGVQGLNSYRKIGYGGPTPPPGKPHRYFFKLYALDLPPNLLPGLTSIQLQGRMNGHILALGEWMGTYKR